MSIRVRFAPSPTGQVHIGNIRTAIFNWLYARHCDGHFLLRIEDTDRERSTPEAIAALLDVMSWLGLDFSEPALYQSSRADAHCAAARGLLESGQAYRFAKGQGGEATIFRIPWNAPELPFVRAGESQELIVHEEHPVEIRARGVDYALRTRKGKAAPAAACLAGFHDLVLWDDNDQPLLKLVDVIDQVLAGEEFSVDQVTKMTYRRHEAVYRDLIKGELAKPLDSMKDFVIVRSDDSPTFHLANVCDDVEQEITHIIRGNDHVENTYRHLFLFHALGAAPPAFAHLPMIVNKQGKPYSKRDGDAFVGDFRAKGFEPQALFNYLTLLGWSPGDGREMMTREELAEAFTLDRVQASDAQMDPNKLLNMNGMYIADLPFSEFLTAVHDAVADEPWYEDLDPAEFEAVAKLMQSRTKLFVQAKDWEYFFTEDFAYDEKESRKHLNKPGVAAAMRQLESELADIPFDQDSVEAAIHRVTEAAEIKRGKLNLPLRLAVTGTKTGAGLYEVMELLGKDRVRARLGRSVDRFCDAE